jgi:hypothetical protein
LDVGSSILALNVRGGVRGGAGEEIMTPGMALMRQLLQTRATLLERAQQVCLPSMSKHRPLSHTGHKGTAEEDKETVIERDINTLKYQKSHLTDGGVAEPRK